MNRVLGFLLLSFVWLACSTDESRSRLEVRLTDSPGDYEEVNIDVQGVQIHRSEGNQNSGWVSLDVKEGVYNILTLTNGLDTLLGTADLPSGRISQIRLILGTNNSVKVDGNVYVLETPSAQQSGLKLNVQTQMSPGITYVITLDFDAARSVSLNGNGGYKLKPVIRAITEATSGAIKGKVTPVDSYPAVFALAGTDTVATAYSDSLGFFLLRAIPPGTYKVTFDPKPGYTPKQVDNVTVTLGVTNDLGEITIN
ncbi:MAG: DUF4382 domain-containing protein [Cyclobacteriaceae bacterium]|nr:DUF4382 domain-containing protein [Cyclobacteriaceae bacterium]